jgi:serine/threonine-protein kinase
MGEVWLAEQEIVRTQVAIKLLHEEPSANQEHVQRFFNEAIAVGKIKHVGIVKIFDVGFYAGRAFLIMEFLEGETLTSRIERLRRLPPTDVAEIGRQIVSILGATHAEGIIHRDLKPDNVFLVPDPELASKERVKIFDFGIAKVGIGITATGDSLGTPGYMAPEQWDHAAQADARTDVYALGCLAFELCCGRPPFVAASIPAVYARQMNELPPRPSSIVPDVPEELDDLIMRMLAREPSSRPTLRDIGVVFSRIVASQPRVFDSKATTIQNSVPFTKPRRWRPRIAVAACIGAIACAAVFGVVRGHAHVDMTAHDCPVGMVSVPAGTFWMGSPVGC